MSCEFYGLIFLCLQSCLVVYGMFKLQNWRLECSLVWSNIYYMDMDMDMDTDGWIYFIFHFVPFHAPFLDQTNWRGFDESAM